VRVNSLKDVSRMNNWEKPSLLFSEFFSQLPSGVFLSPTQPLAIIPDVFSYTPAFLFAGGTRYAFRCFQ